jgi:hypothetical protein
MSFESTSQMMLTPRDGLILVQEPDIFEIVHNEPQKQKLKNLIDKMWYYIHKII